MCVDYYPPDVSREVSRTARKEHRCGECRRTIDPGERYVVQTSLYEGSWWEGKVCAQCRAATEWLIIICRGYLCEDVLDELSDHLYEPPPISSVALGRLVVRMRHQWRRRDGRWSDAEIAELVDRAVTPWRAWEQERAEQNRQKRIAHEAAWRAGIYGVKA